MHVDGFRFDLASALARELFEVDKLGAFFDILHQDPVLANVKLIAEPWDLGSGGYQVGNFPSQWSEWNGRYRDNVRRFWKGDGGALSEFATRLCGSADLYEWSSRRPYASINFITCHDGFNLHDLVSYNEKHNEANGEENRDGANDNQSWNCGAEGPTDDPGIKALRERQKRNLLATLFLSQGVPMLLAGDELGKTQKGNNNCYCQDNEISWLQWDLNDEQRQMLEFVRGVVSIRKTEAVFRRQKFFQGRSIRGEEGAVSDVCMDRHGRKAARRRRLERGLRQMRRPALGRQADRRSRRPWRADYRRHGPVAVERARRKHSIHVAGAGGRRVLAAADGHGSISRSPVRHQRRHAIRVAGPVDRLTATHDPRRRRKAKRGLCRGRDHRRGCVGGGQIPRAGRRGPSRRIKSTGSWRQERSEGGRAAWNDGHVFLPIWGFGTKFALLFGFRHAAASIVFNEQSG